MALIAATVARPADKDMAFDGCFVVAEFLVQALLVYCCKPGLALVSFSRERRECGREPHMRASGARPAPT